MGKLTTEPAPFAPIRKAGVFLLLTAAATAVMVVLRVAGDTDQATLIESLRAIAEDRGLFGAGGAARFVSGVTLLAAALALSRMGTSVGGLDASFLLYMFGASGILTAVSGACCGAVGGVPSARRERCRSGMGGSYSNPALAYWQGWVRGLRSRSCRRRRVPVAGRWKSEEGRRRIRRNRSGNAAHMGRLGDDHAPHRGSRVLHLADCRRSDANHVARRKAGGWPAVRREGWQSEPLLEGREEGQVGPVLFHCLDLVAPEPDADLPRAVLQRDLAAGKRERDGDGLSDVGPRQV